MPYQHAHPLSQSSIPKKHDLKHNHFEREALFFVASSKALCSIQEICYILLVSTLKKKKDDRAVMGIRILRTELYWNYKALQKTIVPTMNFATSK